MHAGEGIVRSAAEHRGVRLPEAKARETPRATWIKVMGSCRAVNAIGKICHGARMDATTCPLTPAAGRRGRLRRLLRRLGAKLAVADQTAMPGDAAMLEPIPQPAALCELVRVGDSEAIDFVYVACNSAFASFAGKSRAQLVGSRAGTTSLRLHVYLLGTADRVVATGQPAHVALSEPFTGRCYEAVLHRHRRGAFLLLLDDLPDRQPSTAAGMGDPGDMRLRFAVEAAQMGVWSRDLRTNLYTGCEGISRLVDRSTTSEHTPVELFEAMHPDDRAKVAAAIVQTNREGRVPNAEFRVVHRDGSIHWMEVRGGILRDQDGKPSYAVGVALDITERKRASEALTRANRAHATLSGASVAVMQAQSEDDLLKAACRVLTVPGGYRVAAIGYAQNDAERSILLKASAGDEAGWVVASPVSWSDNGACRRPIEHAIRDRKVEVLRDIAAAAHTEWQREALARGFRANAAFPLSDGGRVFGALSLYTDDPAAFDAAELALLEQIAGVISFGIVGLRGRLERQQALTEQISQDALLVESLEASIQAVASTIELRDPYTAGHQRRVAALAHAIAAHMGLPATTVHGIRLAATVHDVGKVRIPAEILTNPGRLSKAEMELIKMHAEAGYEILKDVRSPWPLAEMVRQHHERMDGKGYPRGLAGDQILPEARIIAVADVMESVASQRPYRPALGVPAALHHVAGLRGSHLDADAVDACLALFETGRFEFPSAN
jgi:HD-GYP domain-containing protein (c-di-GMP phosphodiesterase class II)/PAS domain-containing protein